MLITIDLPDDNFQDLIDTYAVGYADMIPDPVTGSPMPNPLSKQEFAQSQLFTEIRSSMAQFKLRQAEALIPHALAAAPITVTFAPSTPAPTI